MVLKICIELSKFIGNNGRNGSWSRPYNNHEMDPSIFTWNRKESQKVLRPTNDSWRVDETYIKVKGKWKYPYSAVDSTGDTIDFMLSAKRNRKAAKRFLRKALGLKHNQIPRAITVDKNPAYPVAMHNWKMIEYYLKM
jgi:transposase-like protein